MPAAPRPSVTETQLEAFLVSALIASGSLLLAVFGNLYSIYTAYMREGGAPICKTLRWLCYCLTLAILVVSLTNLFIIYLLSQPLVLLAGWLPYSLYLIVLLIMAPPLTISWGMHKDARA
jgi:hypothetical protein